MSELTWAEVTFGWDPKFTAEIKDVLVKWSQTKTDWKQVGEDKWSPSYHGYKFIIPLQLAEAIAQESDRQSFEVIRLTCSGLRAFIEKLPEQPKLSDSLNQRLNIAIPGNALMAVQQIRVEENACTDEIQCYLNEGWCILAICPQAQRRPDYILGKIPSVVSAAEEALGSVTHAAYLKCFQPTPVIPKPVASPEPVVPEMQAFYGLAPPPPSSVNDHEDDLPF